MKKEVFTRYRTDGTKQYWDGDNWVSYPTKEEQIQKVNKSLTRQCRTIGLAFLIITIFSFFRYNKNWIAVIGLMVISVPAHLLGLVITLIIHIRKLNKLK